MTEQKENSNSQIIQLVNFRLGNEEFGVDIGSVREIVRISAITHIPQAPSFIQGVINLRGKVIPIIDLALKFNLPHCQESSKTARIIITELKNYPVGILVDEVPEISKLPAKNIESALGLTQSGLERDYIRGVGKLGKRLIIILDLEKILSTNEITDITAISKKKNGD